MDSRIENLVAYARNQGDADRTALFRNLIDLFLAQDAPANSRTREQLLDVLAALIPHVDEASRETAASLIASMAEPPMDLVNTLALDEAHLIKDLLQRVEFDEDDLIALIEKTGRAHHQEIAARPNLSANVWIALARAAPNRNQRPSLSDTQLFDENLGRAPRSATVTALHPDKLPGEEPRAPGISVIRRGDSLRDDDTDSTAERPPLPSFLAEPKAGHLGDPGADGWAFRSNRDGFITHLSPNARKLFADSTHALGEALLDFLGLNSKLGHPVARAFQRRSPIDGSPIYIDGCPKGKRYWHLEAVPRFNADSGGFDGYDGRLSPVSQDTPISEQQARDARGESAPSQAEPDDFLSEQQRQPAPAGTPIASKKPISPNPERPVERDSLAGDSFDNFLDQAPVGLASGLDDNTRCDAASEKTMHAAEPSAGEAAVSDKLMNQLQSAMAHMQAETRKAVEDQVSDFFKARTPQQPVESPAQPAEQPAAAQTAPEIPAHAPEPAESQTNTDATSGHNPSSDPAEATAANPTLAMLETAANVFLAHAKKTGDINLRLQAEIALACVRTLLDD